MWWFQIPIELQRWILMTPLVLLGKEMIIFFNSAIAGNDIFHLFSSDITTRSEIESRGEGVDINPEDVPSTSS